MSSRNEVRTACSMIGITQLEKILLYIAIGRNLRSKSAPVGEKNHTNTSNTLYLRFTSLFVYINKTPYCSKGENVFYKKKENKALRQIIQ